MTKANKAAMEQKAVGGYEVIIGRDIDYQNCVDKWSHYDDKIALLARNGLEMYTIDDHRHSVHMQDFQNMRFAEKIKQYYETQLSRFDSMVEASTLCINVARSIFRAASPSPSASERFTERSTKLKEHFEDFVVNSMEMINKCRDTLHDLIAKETRNAKGSKRVLRRYTGDHLTRAIDLPAVRALKAITVPRQSYRRYQEMLRC